MSPAPVDEVDQWIAEAATALGREFKPASAATQPEVLAKARSVFVIGNPRLWWLGLRHAPRSTSTDVSIESVLPPGTAWFVPESESGRIYELTPAEIESIRQECPLFEFNVVDKRFTWLVCETDHGQFLSSRVPAPEASRGDTGVVLLERSGAELCRASVRSTAVPGLWTGVIDGSPGRSELCERFEALVTDQVLSALDDVEREIEALDVVARFDRGMTETSVLDLQVFPSTMALSFRAEEREPQPR